MEEVEDQDILESFDEWKQSRINAKKEKKGRLVKVSVSKKAKRARQNKKAYKEIIANLKEQADKLPDPESLTEKTQCFLSNVPIVDLTVEKPSRRFLPFTSLVRDNFSALSRLVPVEVEAPEPVPLITEKDMKRYEETSESKSGPPRLEQENKGKMRESSKKKSKKRKKRRRKKKKKKQGREQEEEQLTQMETDERREKMFKDARRMSNLDMSDSDSPSPKRRKKSRRERVRKEEKNPPKIDVDEFIDTLNGFEPPEWAAIPPCKFEYQIKIYKGGNRRGSVPIFRESCFHSFGRAECPDKNFTQIMDTFMSRFHCTLVFGNHAVFAYDSSTHGTFINDVHIPSKEYIQFKLGDKLKFAQCPLEFTLDVEFIDDEDISMEDESLETEPTLESDPTMESEPTMDPERAMETEPTKEPEPTVESKPTMNPERAMETEPTREPKPTVESKLTLESNPNMAPERAMETEPTLESEPIKDPERAMETEPTVESKPTLDPERAMETKPTREPEPTVESEPTREPEPTEDPKPTLESEPTVESEFLESEDSDSEPAMETEPTKTPKIEKPPAKGKFSSINEAASLVVHGIGSEDSMITAMEIAEKEI